MKHPIQSSLIAIACSLALLAAPAQATEEGLDTSTTKESLGAVSGFLVGGALGGPAGALAASLAGSWVGEQVTIRKNYRAIAAQLEASEAKLASLESTNAAMQMQQMSLQKRLQERELLASTEAPVARPVDCCEQSEVVMHFRTNSSNLEPHYQTALLRFIEYSKAHPQMVVEITGHADRRGDTTANLLLSQHRVETVLQSLRKQGLSAATYQTVAFGEQEPLTAIDQMENNFFDRRVVLRLKEANPSMLSSTGH
ncbi:MAG: sortase-associated OmpA-like protein PdsO [Pseudomonadota bacterium]